jgi:serine/threonine protein kinase
LDPALAQRFEREAKTLAASSHPHICTVFDVGRHDGMTYLVLKHLKGGSLSERLEHGQLDVDELVLDFGLARKMTAAPDELTPAPAGLVTEVGAGVLFEMP